MTTITIKDGLEDKNINVKNPQEALQKLLDSLGYTYLFPIRDKKISQKLKKHSDENKDRPLEDFDNI